MMLHENPSYPIKSHENPHYIPYAPFNPIISQLYSMKSHEIPFLHEIHSSGHQGTSSSSTARTVGEPVASFAPGFRFSSRAKSSMRPANSRKHSTERS